ncbi:MAG: hypothetical protein DCC75_04925 [Proteobacteria bacterium]|nr:MAG: hypothetical protein DCC75_04925 [Pseudomonadota bacterium]
MKILGSDSVDPTSGTSDTAHIDDFSAIRRVLAGQKEEFRRLISAHQTSITNLMLRQVGNCHLAEELSQEIFVKAYLHLSKFRFESSFRTWLTAIALNHLNTFLCSKGHRQRARTESLESVSEAVCSGSAIDEASESELMAVMRTALMELPKAYRDTVILIAIEGRSYEEAAAIMEVPPGTVRSRLCKGRKRIKKYFESRRV